MNKKLKIFMRSVQTFFPFLQDFRFALQRGYRSLFKIPYEKDFRALRLFSSDDNEIFLDVGTNRGQSVDAILMHKKRCTIHSFEPNLLLHPQLNRRFMNNKNVIIHPFGLGNEFGNSTLYVPFYKKYMFDGLSSFDRDKAKKWLENRLMFFNKENLDLKEIKCETRRLDDLNLEPYFIKIDVQGHELEVLKGGENTIKRYRPVLLIESPGKKIVDFLKPLGYRMYGYRRGQLVADERGRVNTFFIGVEKISEVAGDLF